MVPRSVRGKLGRAPVNMVTTQRTYWHFNWTPNTTTTDGFARRLTYTLSGLPSVGEFTGVFDMYKINAIKVVLRPRYDGFAGNDTTDTVLPGVTNQGRTMVHVLRDMYGQYVPSGSYSTNTLNSFFEQGTKVKTYPGNRDVVIYYRPTVDVYNNVNSADKRSKSMWYSTTSTGVVHYGPCVFLQDVNLTGTFNQSFDVYVTMYMSFKGIK